MDIFLLIVPGVVLALCFAAHLGPFSWVLAVLAGAIYYRIDIWLRPLVSCRVCKGSGVAFRSSGSNTQLMPQPFRVCLCCRGKKSHPRFAAKILARRQYDHIKSGGHGRNY